MPSSSRSAVTESWLYRTPPWSTGPCCWPMSWSPTLRCMPRPTAIATGVARRLLHITVRDGSPRLLRVVASGPQAPGGRGLWLVEQLAHAWGREPAPRRRQGRLVHPQAVQPIPRHTWATGAKSTWMIPTVRSAITPSPTATRPPEPSGPPRRSCSTISPRTSLAASLRTPTTRAIHRPQPRGVMLVPADGQDSHPRHPHLGQPISR